MTKRLIDVDDAKLNDVRALLGTATAKATVNTALDEVLALAARRQELLDKHVLAGSEELADVLGHAPRAALVHRNHMALL